MRKQLLIDKLIKEELYRCTSLYNELSALSATLPKGSLVDRNGHPYHIYRENGKQIRKAINDPVLLYNLKLHHFLKEGLPLLKSRIDACNAFINKSKIYDPVKLIDEMADVYRDVDRNLLFLTSDVDPLKWKQETFARNSIPFNVDHHTNAGRPVRSKAEAMIGTQMENRGWVYVCEPRMYFGGEVKTPDFAVLHPITREIIYLEHFGRMGDYDYVADTMNKLLLYSQNGLHLGVNFFFTWESVEKPLTYKEINAVLDKIEAAGC